MMPGLVKLLEVTGWSWQRHGMKRTCNKGTECRDTCDRDTDFTNACVTEALNVATHVTEVLT